MKIVNGNENCFLIYCIIGYILFSVKEQMITEQLLDIGRMENAIALFGSFDENVKLLCDIAKNRFPSLKKDS